MKKTTNPTGEILFSRLSLAEESGRLYKALVRACPDAITITDLKGTIIEVSEKTISLHGIDNVDGLLGRNAFDFIAPEDRERAAANLEKTLEQGVTENLEYTFLNGRGEKFLGELNASVVRNKRGDPVAFIATMRDITKRKETERSLRESEQKYRTLFNGAADAIFSVEIRQDGSLGNIFEINDVGCRNLGYTREELISMKPTDLDPMENPEAGERYKRELATTGASTVETCVIKKDGARIDVELNSHLMDIGEKKVILTIARDITDRRRVEKELRKADKLESLGILAGGIAHDFNNILTGIVGNLSLAVSGQKTDCEDSAKIRKALEAALRAQNLTQQLLTFAKGGSPVTKTGSVVKLVKDTVDLALSGSSAKYEIQVEPEMAAVDMDEGQISQVVSNLAINAGQSMPNGGTVRINISNALVAENRFPGLPAGDYVRISFEDSGVGIIPEHLHRIFDPYFTTKQRGTGLGLATALSVVKNHEGHIDVESRVGVGSVFSVYLPAVRESRLPPEPREIGGTMSGKRILIMDDNDMIREILSEMISSLDCVAMIACDGPSAIEIVERAARSGEKIDAAILDLTIPGGMGGADVLAQIKKTNPSIKGIVSSGYSTANVMSNFKKFGFAGVLKKPYNFEALRKLLNEVLEES